MEIIGNVNEFAIQYEISDAYESECFGNIVYWIGGEQIGRSDYEVWINCCINWVRDFNNHKSFRTYPNSHLLSKRELFYELYDRFYNEIYHSIDTRSIFHLDDTGDASFADYIGIILIDEPFLDRQRFIWRHHKKEDVVYEFFIPINLYEKVSEKFCNQASLKWKSLLESQNIS